MVKIILLAVLIIGLSGFKTAGAISSLNQGGVNRGQGEFLEVILDKCEDYEYPRDNEPNEDEFFWNKELSKEELLRIKKADPRKFNELILYKRARINNRLNELKQGDSEKYQAVMRNIRAKRLQRLQRLKKDNPGKFKEIIEKRRARIAVFLERLKAEDPHAYQQFRGKGKEFLLFERE